MNQEWIEKYAEQEKRGEKLNAFQLEVVREATFEYSAALINTGWQPSTCGCEIGFNHSKHSDLQTTQSGI